MSGVPYRILLLLVALAGYGLRVYGLGHQSFWLDEVDAIAMAAEPAGTHLRKLTAIGENGPLYFILFKGWVQIAGTSEFGARYLSAMASTAAIPLLAALAQALFRRPEISIVAAVLAAASPFYVWFGQDAKMYPLFAALTLGAQYCLVRAATRDSPPRTSVGAQVSITTTRSWPWWLGYVACSSLALYVHIFAALQLVANTVAGFVWCLSRRARWRGYLIATLLLIAPYLPLAAWHAPVLIRGANVGYQPTDLQTIVVTLLQQFTWHLNASAGREWLFMLVLVLALGLWRTRLTGDAGAAPASVAPAARRLPATPALLLWLLVPIALVYAMQSSVPVFRDRYLTPLMAPFLLLLAHAMAPVQTLRPAEAMPNITLRVAGALSGAFIAGSFVYGFAHRPANPDFRAAAAFVATEMQSNERIGFLAGYAERPFGYYLTRLVPVYQRVDLPYTDYPGMTDQDGLLAVARVLRGGETLWVVRFEHWLWDSRDLLGVYLRHRGATILDQRDFNGVSVTRYQIP
jgi:mannosyltransferase